MEDETRDSKPLLAGATSLLMSNQREYSMPDAAELRILQHHLMTFRFLQGGLLGPESASWSVVLLLLSLVSATIVPSLSCDVVHIAS
jgi:hypothetical protein